MPTAKLQVTGPKMPRRAAHRDRGPEQSSAHVQALAQMKGKKAVAIDPIILSDKELEAIASSSHVGRKWNLTDSD